MLTLLALPISNAQQLVVGFFDFPPLLYYDEKNQITGRIANRLQALARDIADVDFVYKRFPPKRFYAEVVRGNIDLCFASKGSPIVDVVHLSRAPVFKTRISLFTKQTSPLIKDVADLNNKRIGGLRGFDFLGRVKKIHTSSKNLIYHPVNNRNSLYNLLAAGRIDYALDYGLPAQQYLHQSQLGIFHELPLEFMHVYIAIPKSKPNALQLMKKLDTLLTTIDNADPL